jgi:hypothetical protein
VPPAKRRKRGAKAPGKASTTRAMCSASVRGCGRKSVKAVVDRLLVDVEMGASDELLLLIKQSFRDETVVTLLRPEWKLE